MNNDLAPAFGIMILCQIGVFLIIGSFIDVSVKSEVFEYASSLCKDHGGLVELRKDNWGTTQAICSNSDAVSFDAYNVRGIKK